MGLAGFTIPAITNHISDPSLLFAVSYIDLKVVMTFVLGVLGLFVIIPMLISNVLIFILIK